MIHILIAGSIFALDLIKLIPMAVLFGLFLFMGFATLGGNQFWDRVMMWITDKALYPDTEYVRKVPIKVISAFTLIQVVSFAALWVLKVELLGILFPVLIAMLVPVRLFMNKKFSAEHLRALDSERKGREGEAASSADAVAST